MKKSTIPCPDCGGIGTVSRGHVVVEEKTFDPAYASQHFPATCDKCNGFGHVSASSSLPETSLAISSPSS